MNGSTSRCRSTARVAEAVWSWSAAHRNIRKRSYGARWRAALISRWAAAAGVAAESKAGIRCRRPMRWAWAACNWGRHRDRELACLRWTSPAWKMKPRDAWIGWSDEQRQRHLQVLSRQFILSRMKGGATSNDNATCKGSSITDGS